MMAITTGVFAYYGIDDAHITLTDNVNTKNCVQWVNTNLHALFNGATITVWHGIKGIIVLGPYFFEKTTSTGFIA